MRSEERGIINFSLHIANCSLPQAQPEQQQCENEAAVSANPLHLLGLFCAIFAPNRKMLAVVPSDVVLPFHLTEPRLRAPNRCFSGKTFSVQRLLDFKRSAVQKFVKSRLADDCCFWIEFSSSICRKMNHLIFADENSKMSVQSTIHADYVARFRTSVFDCVFERFVFQFDDFVSEIVVFLLQIL